MIRQEELMAVVSEHRGDAVVLTTMTAGRCWTGITTLPDRDLHVGGAMGKASSVALGIALARSDVKVILFDGDGSLLMNLGSLVTIAGKEPKNLYHFAVQNGVYATTGGQPIPNHEGVSLASIARGAGYKAAYEFDDLEEFTTNLEEVLGQAGPVFITLKTVPEVQNLPIGQRPPSRTPSLVDQIKGLKASFAGGS